MLGNSQIAQHNRLRDFLTQFADFELLTTYTSLIAKSKILNILAFKQEYFEH